MPLMKATSVTGPAKNLIEFARRATCHGAEITVVTFERAGVGSAFAGAVQLAGTPVRAIAERRRLIRESGRRCAPPSPRTAPTSYRATT
jgi:hypothetical protein